MVNFINGKIYKISHITAVEGDGNIYIGSTTKISLLSRMEEHLHDYQGWKLGCRNYTKITSFDVFDKFDVENCHIVLLENCPCNSKEKLLKREAHKIKTIPNVNKNLPGITKKMWYEEHKEENSEKGKAIVVCCCGSKVSQDYLRKHLKSKKHFDLISTLPSIHTASI